MNLVWKLLRQHISIGQFVGFTLANLIGISIILVGLQFYLDASSIFSSRDSFMKKDYLVVSKKVASLSEMVKNGNEFSEQDIIRLKKQEFTESVGAFQPADFRVSASLGMEDMGMNFSTEMFFESVPDEYIDIQSSQWKYAENSDTIPIILPRTYLNLYNFSFAQTKGLSKLSEDMIKTVTIQIQISGRGMHDAYKGKIAGFSNRLNTILVPQQFMDFANRKYGKGEPLESSRLIVEVKNPTDDAIVKYFQEKGYETEDDKLDQGKTTWFLKTVVGLVMGVGVLITALALYILMLSIYLLVQKNTTKLENLLLIGYSPARVALPYQWLTAGLNALVLVLSFVLLLVVRARYLHLLTALYPDLAIGGLGTAIVAGIALFVVVSLLNALVIRQKIAVIWKRKD